MLLRSLSLFLLILVSAAAGDAAAPAKPGTFDIQQRKATQWAWQPIHPSEPPRVKDASWPANPIDQFILARLESKGLRPASAADKRTLIRRAYFDLVGLPPRRDAIDAFLNDSSPDAFANVVDGLLVSPHFGERWARHWMDLARYAEGYGHEFDYPIANAWRYRDYLIRAFNADVPYDQFVREQIAGDLLPEPRKNPEDGSNESIVATGFWWFGEQTHAPVDVRQHEADWMENQIDVFGKTFLGLTISCARCHDHKFDPIAQKDYYSLMGILESSTRQDAFLDPHDNIAAAVKQMRLIRQQADATFVAGLPKTDEEFRDALAKRLLSSIPSPGTPGEGQGEGFSREHANSNTHNHSVNPHPSPLPAYRERGKDGPSNPMFAWAALSKASPDDFETRRAHAMTELATQQHDADESRKASEVFKSFSDGSYNGWFTTGWAFADAPTSPGQWDPLTDGARAIHPGAAHSGMLGMHLPGVLRSPTFTLTRPEILYHVAGKNARIHLIIDGYRMDLFNGLLFQDTRLKVDTGGKFVWLRQAHDVSRYVGHQAHIEVIDDGDGWVALDEVRFADKNAPLPIDEPSPVTKTILEDTTITSPQALAKAYANEIAGTIDRWQKHTLDSRGSDLLIWAINHDLMRLTPEAAKKLQDLRGQLEQLDRDLPQPPRALAMTDISPMDEHVFLRGNYRNLGPVAPRGFLEAIDGPNAQPMTHGSGRLELARRMLDPSDPFVPRVMVNRIWHHLFGRGIVQSVDNFGLLGTPPSHPELLDYLADRFVREGWSVKKMIRLMMLSRTYQMASVASDESAEQLDPDNVLLHRANIRRLEAEAIRDSILSVSGRLDDHIGGPSVDVFLTPFMEGRGRPASGPLDGDGRRSLYLATRRNFISPMMQAFDAPTPFSTMGRRTVSNVPAQALILMNDPFVLDQAKRWAERSLADKSLTADQRIDAMYTAAFARPATPQEHAKIDAFLTQHGEELQIPPADRATNPRLWTDLAHALLNTKEFIFLN